MMGAIDDGRRRRRLRTISCVGVLLGLPLILAVGLVITWSVNNRPPRIDLPAHPLPANNAALDFHRAFLLAKQMKHTSPYSMTTPPEQSYTDANFAACAQDIGPVDAAVRVGLGHEFMAAPFDPWNAFPQYGEYREVARQLAGAAEHYRRIGKAGESVGLALDGVEMAVKIQRGDAVIGMLVGIAIEAICARRMEEQIPKLDAVQLGAVAARLERIQSEREPLGNLIRADGERSAMTWLNALRDPKSAANPLTSAYYDQYRWLVDQNPSTAAFAAMSQTPKPLTWGQRMTLARFSLANKEAMLRDNLAYSRAVAKECETSPYSPTLKTPRPDNLLMQANLDMFSTFRRMYASEDAMFAILRTEVALERYRRQHGAYPDRLDALVPALLRALPDDPFTGSHGTPLRYRVLPRGAYLLYSVGPDMVDSHGAPLGRYIQDGPGDIFAGSLFGARKDRP